jgi:hypothetical protein
MTIFNLNFFENSAVNFSGNIINGNLVAASSGQWVALMQHYIDKQQERNRKMQQLLSVLEGIAGQERDDVLQGLRLLQDDNEAYLRALQDVATSASAET